MNNLKVGDRVVLVNRERLDELPLGHLDQWLMDQPEGTIFTIATVWRRLVGLAEQLPSDSDGIQPTWYAWRFAKVK